MLSSAENTLRNGVALLVRALDDRLVLSDARAAAAHRLEPLTQPCQRRAQIVRDVTRHLTQALHQRGDAVEHVVDDCRQSIELRLRAGHGNAIAKAPRHHGTTGARDGIDAAQEPGAQHRTTGDREATRVAPMIQAKAPRIRIAGRGQSLRVLAHEQVAAVRQVASLTEHDSGTSRKPHRSLLGRIDRPHLEHPGSRAHRGKIAGELAAVGALQQVAS